MFVILWAIPVNCDRSLAKQTDCAVLLSLLVQSTFWLIELLPIYCTLFPQEETDTATACIHMSL